MVLKKLEMLLPEGSKNRPGTKLRELRGVVIHWTANIHKGADADNNARFFARREDFGSAHYCVDDRQVVICIPETEVAYHVGDKVRPGRHYPVRNIMLRDVYDHGSSLPNFYTIGIEMCVNEDADWLEVYDNTVRLAADILYRHGKDISILMRHFDLTGKDCPKMFLPIMVEGKEYEWNWPLFVNDVDFHLTLLRAQKAEMKQAAAAETDIVGTRRDASLLPASTPPPLADKKAPGCLFFWLK